MVLFLRSLVFVTILQVLTKLLLGHPLPPPQHAAPLTPGQSRNLITNYSPSNPSNPSKSRASAMSHSLPVDKPPVSSALGKKSESYVPLSSEHVDKSSKFSNPLDYSAQVSDFQYMRTHLYGVYREIPQAFANSDHDSFQSKNYHACTKVEEQNEALHFFCHSSSTSCCVL